LAKRVLERKADVLAAIRKQAPSFSVTTGVNVSETSHLPENNEVSLTGSGDNQDQAQERSRSAAAEIHNRLPPSTRRSLIGNGFPPMTTTTPPAAILDTRRRCPACGERFIIPELHWMCGELCFPCAQASGKIGAGSANGYQGSGPRLIQRQASCAPAFPKSCSKSSSRSTSADMPK
jgi:hypothetical protein